MQTAGEAQFVGDIPTLAGQLHTVFVKSTKANATISNIDSGVAFGMPGVVRYV